MVSSRFTDTLAAIFAVLRHAQLQAAVLVAAIATFLAVAFAGTLPPLFAAHIIDALAARAPQTALSALAWYAAITVALAILQCTSNYLTALARENIVTNLRIALMRKLDCSRLDDLSALTLGEVSNRIIGDIDLLCGQLQFAVLPTLQGIITIAATIAVMLRENVLLSVISIAIVLLLAVPARIVTPRLSAGQRVLSSVRDRLVGSINETASLGALTLLRDPRAQARERVRFRDLNLELRRLTLGQVRLSEVTECITSLISLLGPTAILGTGTYLLVTHRLASVGIVIAFLMYYNRLASPFAALSGLPLQIASVGVVARRLMDIFSLREETGGNTAFEAGSIAFRRVAVGRNERPLLHDLTLTVDSGTHLALIGPSGSGKSTIASLFARHFEPTQGDIQIGQQPIERIQLDDLRRHVIVVSQDQLLFDMTLRDNVTFLHPGASSREIDEAIAICELGEVTNRLGSEDASIGQRGFRLSGGERARVCLARALLTRPSILVLDEVLANVDAEMEERILERLRIRFINRTMIVITHRLQSIRSFDAIAVIENGTVSAYGSPSSVAAQSGWYRSVAPTEMVAS